MIALRVTDIVLSVLALTLLSPWLAVVLLLVWAQDRHSPFYFGERAAMGGGTFRMVKIRSMVMNADLSGVESTGSADPRITGIGHFVRRWKLDELSQLWNVLVGEMSLVGPRPNTLRGISDYDEEEVRLLSVRPGITDFSSIVFSDEGEILKGAEDPDREYDRLIRPWKSKLGLLYVDNANMLLNLQLIFITAVAIADKPRALRMLQPILLRLHAGPALIEVAARQKPLETFAVA